MSSYPPSSVRSKIAGRGVALLIAEPLERRVVMCALPHAPMSPDALLPSVSTTALVAAASVTLPGTFQAEDFDTGGEGVAYHDTDAANIGGQYRTEGVDIKTTADSGGGYAVGWTVAGEWLKYTVNVTTAGWHTFDARVASAIGGGKFKLFVNDVDHSGTMTVPKTAGWDVYTTVSARVGLSVGTQEFRVQMTGNGSDGAVGNFNWFRLTPEGTTPPPSPTTVRINVGGGAFTDTAGAVWSADSGYAAGGTVKTDAFPVANTSNDPLYYTRRFGTFSYRVPVENGTYALSLYFTDPVFGSAGQRKFDVFAEGSQILNDLDIAAEVGLRSALVETYNVTIIDGALDLRTAAVVDNPILSALSLERLTTTVPSIAPFAWKTVANNPTALYESQGVGVNGKLYVFGGFYTIDSQGVSRTTQQSNVYDVATDKWTSRAPIPEAITHAGVAVDGDTIWLAGGFVGDNPGPSTAHVWKYSVSRNEWTAGPALPADRSGGALVRLGRELHFTGGGVRRGSQYITEDGDEHWVLNLDNVGAGWQVAPALPNPRNHLAGIELNGKMYVLGGQHLQDEFTGNQSQVDVYDPKTKTWSRGKDIPIPLGHIQAAVAVREGRIVVVGGLTDGKNLVSNVYEYDPSTNAWSALTSLPAGRQSPIAAYINGKLVVTTGLGPGGKTSNVTWVGNISKAWEKRTNMPVPMGEVAAGVIGDHMIVVGEGSSATLAYHIPSGTWGSTTYRPVRPYVGHHHAAEVIGDRLYLFGGLHGGSEGKVQYYDDGDNKWYTGASMPFAAGSSSTAYIGGYVYVAGGIIGTTTTNRVARYNPSTNTWTEMAPMPVGVNHAASATDGTKLYVFGGRTGGNTVGNGFNYVQIYDPATNRWTSSTTTSTIAPLPQARGGMGKAVFYKGELYVMGGETSTGAGATSNGVYARVDVYNPTTNTWRRAADMVTARHGIFPVLRNGRILVAGGGLQAGFAQSSIFDILNLD